MRRPLHAVALGATLALAMAGCADDGSTTTASGSTASSGSSGSSASASASMASTGSTMPAAHAEGTVPAGVAEQYATLEEEIAAEGGDTTTGQWRIAYIVEAAEPWYETQHGHQSWRPPKSGETHHIEIIPIERSTGRIVPDTPIRVEVLDRGGKVVDSGSLNFYYSDFFHYANNFEIPQPGEYTLRATIGVPTFNRHGERSQTPPLAQGTTVTFENVPLEGSG